MKKMMMALAVAAILLSCTKDDEPEPTPEAGRIDIVIPTETMENHATITFGCSTTTTAVRSMTRAALSSISLTDLWVYDLPSGQTTPTLLAHQTASDADFGAPTITAEYGDHTFYFVASRGDTPTTDNTTITWAKPSDTFWSSLTMTVAPSTSASQSVTLQRVAARLRITITDEIPTGLATLSVTPSHWYYALDITTGEATDDRQTARTVSVPTSYIGTTGQLIASFFTISPSAAWSTDVSLQALKTDNTPMASISVADVPMQRNHITDYSGTLFGAGRAISIDADDSWGEDIQGTW
jgi:hypothetical protein